MTPAAARVDRRTGAALLRRASAALLLWISLALPAAASDYEDLVAAERAFAARASEIGVREAFLDYFSADNLGFAPGPVAARAQWQARGPTQNQALWTPSHAEIAASGELGYTFGPHRWHPLDDPDTTAFAGHFFSVWQRDADGRFRNVLDYGISHAAVPFPAETERRGQRPAAAALGSAEHGDRLHALIRADRELAAFADTAARATAQALATPDLAVLREGTVPAFGAEALAAAAPPAGMDLASVRMSAAGDLAITAGWNRDSDQPVVYVRAWRYLDGHWRLAVDLLGQP